MLLKLMMHLRQASYLKGIDQVFAIMQSAKEKDRMGSFVRPSPFVLGRDRQILRRF